jgi:hypothetical protein
MLSNRHECAVSVVQFNFEKCVFVVRGCCWSVWVMNILVRKNLVSADILNPSAGKGSSLNLIMLMETQSGQSCQQSCGAQHRDGHCYSKAIVLSTAQLSCCEVLLCVELEVC